MLIRNQFVFSKNVNETTVLTIQFSEPGSDAMFLSTQIDQTPVIRLFFLQGSVLINKCLSNSFAGSFFRNDAGRWVNRQIMNNKFSEAWRWLNNSDTLLWWVQ